MKLSYITIMVRNIENSVKFYEELVGLMVARRLNVGAGEIIFLSNGDGETMIELIQFENVPKVETKGMTLSFKTENITDIRNKAIQMGFNPSDIISEAPKPAHFNVKDPDGIDIEFSD